MRSIANVLGCGLVALLLSSCISLDPLPRPIEISAKPIEKPKLELPKADQLFFRQVEWVLITPENYEEVFDRLSERGRPVVLFGLTDDGYENIATNLSALRMYIQQQQIIIAAYENYYKESNQALDAANAEINQTAEEANAIKNQEERKPSFFNRIRIRD
jgi:hypothetical protein